MSYKFDGKYGPIPNENKEVNLSNYAKNYINKYTSVENLPKENEKYLHEVFTKYKVVNMESMFNLCGSLKNINVFDWNVSYCKSMKRAFSYCRSIKELDVFKWNTENVEDMSEMFFTCFNLTILNVENWNTSKVTNMDFLFSNCRKIWPIKVDNWNVDKVNTMKGIFSFCENITFIDLSKWNTKNISNMQYMFLNCHKLNTIKGIIDMENCKNYSQLLSSTTNLTSVNIKLPKNVSEKDFYNEAFRPNTSAVHFIY